MDRRSPVASTDSTTSMARSKPVSEFPGHDNEPICLLNRLHEKV